LVTNQSAIGRGILDESRLDQIHAELIRQLGGRGASIDAIYHCPTAPRSTDRSVIEDPDRKPGPGMLLRAAADLKLELSTSWMIGDSISDVLAGWNAGCQSILISSDDTTATRADESGRHVLVVSGIAMATDMILRFTGIQ
jgi:D-glycero-D-manno-heptose 1,7-bisphosphate phosphatase